MENLLPLLIIALIAWFWVSASNAREAAVRAARSACRRHGVQLLDETVELDSMRPRRGHDGRMTFARRYRFEFTITGGGRQPGSVRLLGGVLEGVELEAGPEAPPEVEAPPPPPTPRRLPLGWKVLDGGSPGDRDEPRH